MTLTIKTAHTADLQLIHELAQQIWWPTYRSFIPERQIQLMLNEFYSVSGLMAQVADQQTFAIAYRDAIPVGFVGFRKKVSEQKLVMRIEKLYILPTEQGKGTGKQLIAYVAEQAQQQSVATLELNVNRSNPAVQYYLKQGFTIVAETDTAYHEFVLDDYVMQRKI